MKKFIKTVYFDEGSATDFIYVVGGGKETNKTEEIVNKTSDIAAQAEAEINGKKGLFSVLSAKIGFTGTVSYESEGTTLITKAIENTILTDYLKCVEKNGDTYIRVFDECTPYPKENSFAYAKMITPYLVMTDGQVDVGQDMKLNLSLMDQALDRGRGYYELILQYDDETIVLRFNIKAFRNNYTISDLVKMKLDYHAIEVGEIDINSLNMENEFSINEKKEISGYDIVNENETNNEKIKVYDVILAGVCR